MFFSLLFQLVVVVLAAMMGWLWQDSQFAQAIFFGGLVAVVNSGMLVVRWHRGLTHYHCDGLRHLKSFNRSMLERFFVVSLLLAVGFGWLVLLPHAMLLGFVVGQLVWALAMMLTRRLF